MEGGRLARRRIAALGKMEQEKNNNIHSMMMAFVYSAVLRFNSVNSISMIRTQLFQLCRY